MAAIGIFRTKDAAKAMGDNLQSLVARGLLDPKNADEWAAALINSAKAMEDVADQAKVAAAALPQFQAALNDASNARKQLDSLAVEGMSVNRSFFTEIGQQLRQGVSAWDAFKNAGLNALGKVADKLAQMAADKLFASAFGGSSGGLLSLLGLGGGGSDLGSFTSIAAPGGGTMPFAAANGGTFGPGWGVVGERGPELINVHKGGVTVIPNHISKPYLPGFADGGTMNASGSVGRMGFGRDSGPSVVLQDNRQINIGQGASNETVAQLREELARDRANRHADTVKAVRMAQKKREL